MKHHLFVWGTNPQPFRGKADSSIVLPISVEEMARIGIPARKIPRVREELQRLIAADPALRDRKMVLQLARQITAEILCRAESIDIRQHRTIPALRLKHRSGGCGTASALPKCSIIHKVLSALLA